MTTVGKVWDESSKKAHWKNRAAGQPFFAVFNITTTHEGQIRLDDAQFAKVTAPLDASARHDPMRAQLPPYYPDTPLVREELARMYDNIADMDGQGDVVGGIVVMRHGENALNVINRVKEKLKPACVEVCPTQARIFGDLKHPVHDDPIQKFYQDNLVMALKPHLGTEPRLLYAGMDKEVR